SGSSARQGLHRAVVDFGSSTTSTIELFIKIKPHADEVRAIGEVVAALCSREVGQAFAHAQPFPGLAGCHLRETAVYQQTDECFRRHAPALLGSVHDEEHRCWILILE